MTDSGSDVDNTIINTQNYSYMHETCTRPDLSTFHHGWKKIQEVPFFLGELLTNGLLPGMKVIFHRGVTNCEFPKL